MGALDDEGELSSHGMKMAEMPLDPLLSKMLLTACDTYSCVNEVLSIVAMLNVPNVFIRPRDQQEKSDKEKSKFAHPDGDHLTFLNVFNAYIQNDKNADWCWNHYLNVRALNQANSIREQLIRLLVNQKCNLNSNPTSHPHYYRNIKKAVLSGFFMQTALLQRAGHYLTLKDD